MQQCKPEYCVGDLNTIEVLLAISCLVEKSFLMKEPHKQCDYVLM